MHDAVDRIVLFDELACEDVLPVQWHVGSAPPDRFTLGRIEESNVLLLRACVAQEEGHGRERSEDSAPLAAELARLELKITLALQLLGQLVQPHEPSALVAIRFNALGACWDAQPPMPACGERGVLRVRLHGSLPQALELEAQVTGVQARSVTARFLEPPAPVAELMQQLAFLRHRRHVAESRKARD